MIPNYLTNIPKPETYEEYSSWTEALAQQLETTAKEIDDTTFKLALSHNMTSSRV